MIWFWNFNAISIHPKPDWQNATFMYEFHSGIPYIVIHNDMHYFLSYSKNTDLFNCANVANNYLNAYN